MQKSHSGLAALSLLAGAVMVVPQIAHADDVTPRGNYVFDADNLKLVDFQPATLGDARDDYSVLGGGVATGRGFVGGNVTQFAKGRPFGGATASGPSGDPSLIDREATCIWHWQGIDGDGPAPYTLRFFPSYVFGASGTGTYRASGDFTGAVVMGGAPRRAAQETLGGRSFHQPYPFEGRVDRSTRDWSAGAISGDIVHYPSEGSNDIVITEHVVLKGTLTAGEDEKMDMSQLISLNAGVVKDSVTN